MNARQALIAAGRDLLVEGEGGVIPSVVAVCERAGCHRSAFYGHYLDRDEYVLELLDSVLADLTEALICEAVQGPFDLAEQVRHFASTVRSPASEELSRLRSAYLGVLRSLDEHDRVRKQHADVVEQTIDLVATAVRCGQEAGQFRDDVDPRATAQSLMLLSITGVLWSDSGIPMDSEALGESLVHILEASPPS